MPEIKKETLGASGIQALKRLKMVIGEIEAASYSVEEAVEVDGVKLIEAISQESLRRKRGAISIKVVANNQLDGAIQPDSHITGTTNIVPFVSRQARQVEVEIESTGEDTEHKAGSNVIRMSEIVEARKRKLAERKAA